MYVCALRQIPFTFKAIGGNTNGNSRRNPC